MPLRPIIGKRLDVLTKADIQEIQKYLDYLSTWPWTPKHILKINNATDLEFAAKSPEVISKLCDYILYLLDIIEKMASLKETKSNS